MSQEEISCHRKEFHATVINVLLQKEISCHGNTQITAILNVFCRVQLPLFRAKFWAERISSHEIKYLIQPWGGHRTEKTYAGRGGHNTLTLGTPDMILPTVRNTDYPASQPPTKQAHTSCR